ncbi:MAG: DUF4278 domain-containing protein [Cyanobacteria bacterium P01_D01_bin.44]
MKLTYRGKTYEATSPAVEVSETLQEGLFLGTRYKVKQHNVAIRHQAPTQLTYRGVRYTR